ncbi:MAG: UDP-N-acetylmuramoyl-tripeptide--D-alanyl-D-alanine ligase [Oligoflexia bacterium]
MSERVSPMHSNPFKTGWIQSVLASAQVFIPSHAQADAHGFSSITTDSRKIQGNELFVAIRGETFDGHAFIEQALASGASGVLGDSSNLTSNRISTLSGQYPKATFFVVSDVLQAYRALGQAWRAQFNIPVIVVAGSNGKTTTKEILAAMLLGRHKSVLRTQGSQNGFLGIPMTLLELRPEHTAAVIEVGIDDVGAMARHIECVQPTHAVLTVIGPEHLENLKDLATVAHEELIALKKTLDLGGRIAIHLDDPWILAWAQSVAAQNLITLNGPSASFSLERPATVTGKITPSGLTVTAQNQSFDLVPPLPGRHNLQNLLAAAATALLTGLEPEEIIRGLSHFQGAEGRSQIRSLSPSRLVICDYYNASPVSMKAAFELLATTGPAHAQRWACLADMKELGPDELQFHRELAAPLLEAKPTGILLHGHRMKSLLEELRSQGFSGPLEHFETPESLAQALKPRLGDQDVVLLKGSRIMKMEIAWQTLST